MTPFPALIADLRAVAAAVIDAQGVLLQANAGFIRLLPASENSHIGRKVARYFIQPGFAILSAGSGHRGMMTLGDPTGKTRTLVGSVSRVPEGIQVVAEYDIQELERMNDAILELNREASTAQRVLTHDNLALKQREVQIVEASLTDALTGVGNRRMLDQALEVEITRACRRSTPLGMIMADLDHFKRVNDQYGHAAGDKVLARFGEILRSQTRPTDIVARFGGEEFALLLPHTPPADVTATAERIRRKLADETIPPLPAPLTCSFGVASLLPGEGAASLLGRVDAALYQAKNEGRNRVAPAAPA